MSGIGTPTTPWDLQTALSAAQLQDGARARTLYVAAGVGDATYTGNVSGSEAHPLVVRPVAPGVVRLYCLDTTGMSDVEFHGFEFAYDWTSRDYTKITLPSPVLTAEGARVKFINCIFHDLPQVSSFAAGTATEFYGCVFYNNGVSSEADRTQLHNIYAQNNAGNPVKKFTNCIFQPGFSEFVIHAYGESGQLVSFEFDGCAANGTIMLVGGSQPVQDLTLNDCYINAILRIGYTADVTPQDATITGCEFEKPVEVYSFATLTFTGNTSRYIRPIYLFPGETDDTQDYVIDNNHYYNNDTRWEERPGGVQTIYWGLAQWQASGRDANATQTAVGAISELDAVTVQANAYDATRAHIIVRNRAAADTVTADVSAVLSPGAAYRLRNSQDYYGDVQTGTVAGNGTISIDVQAANRSVAVPTGYPEALAATTFPAWGAFVLEAI